MHEGLISRLQNEPHLDKIYFDKNGGWLFVPNKLHTIIKTREEIFQEYEAGLSKDSEELIQIPDEVLEKDNPADVIETKQPVDNKKKNKK